MGSVFSAVGDLMSGFGAAQASRLQAQIAGNNAAIATRNSITATQAGDTAATQVGLKTRAIVGSTKAIQGASGLDVNAGSAPDVRASEAEIGQYDALMAKSNAARAAYGYQEEAATQLAQRKLDKAQATQAEVGGVINAGASLFGGQATARTESAAAKESGSGTVLGGASSSGGAGSFYDQALALFP